MPACENIVDNEGKVIEERCLLGKIQDESKGAERRWTESIMPLGLIYTWRLLLHRTLVITESLPLSLHCMNINSCQFFREEINIQTVVYRSNRNKPNYVLRDPVKKSESGLKGIHLLRNRCS